MDGRLDLRAIEQALAVARVGTGKERAAFHQPYRLHVGVAPVDEIEVLTPFRRIALTAEQRRLAGDLSFGQRQAMALAEDTADRLELWVELSFHPLNTYVGVPNYDVALVLPSSARILPTKLDRVPRFGPRVEGTGLRLGIPGGSVPAVGSQPLSGGTLIAQFEAHELPASGRYVVEVTELGTPLARATLDLAGLR